MTNTNKSRTYAENKETKTPSLDSPVTPMTEELMTRIFSALSPISWIPDDTIIPLRKKNKL